MATILTAAKINLPVAAVVDHQEEAISADTLWLCQRPRRPQSLPSRREPLLASSSRSLGLRAPRHPLQMLPEMTSQLNRLHPPFRVLYRPDVLLVEATAEARVWLLVVAVALAPCVAEERSSSQLPLSRKGLQAPQATFSAREVRAMPGTHPATSMVTGETRASPRVQVSHSSSRWAALARASRVDSFSQATVPVEA